ncbi:MAG TPA: NYN domain-containing protein [Candidatus Aquilonibacter sp.]|nr:NYN domain-containing protein [Candidatus Aquilonibacter sp.]
MTRLLRHLTSISLHLKGNLRILRRYMTNLTRNTDFCGREVNFLTMETRFQGHVLRNAAAVVSPTAKDVFLSREQKGVDMRIGIDVATLSLKRIVERIILISGDTDMIPAMKLARREGVQVVLVEIGITLSKSLDEDADLVRVLKPVS